MTGDMISQEAKSEREKIVTHFARIVVGGTVEKPYYSILWFDPADKEYHEGYSSYNYEYVALWLSEEFEIVGDGFSNEPVVHGRWGYEAGHRGCTFVACRMICDQCGAVVTRIDGGIYNYCPNCGAKMDGEA